MYVDFWFERSGIDLRHFLGIDHIMWESDYPHITSTFPNSREHVARTVGHLPADERKQLLYENALRLYDIEFDVAPELA